MELKPGFHTTGYVSFPDERNTIVESPDPSKFRPIAQRCFTANDNNLLFYKPGLFWVQLLTQIVADFVAIHPNLSESHEFFDCVTTISKPGFPNHNRDRF